MELSFLFIVSAIKFKHSKIAIFILVQTIISRRHDVHQMSTNFSFFCKDVGSTNKSVFSFIQEISRDCLVVITIKWDIDMSPYHCTKYLFHSLKLLATVFDKSTLGSLKRKTENEFRFYFVRKSLATFPVRQSKHYVGIKKN